MLRHSHLASIARAGRQWGANGAVLKRNFADKPSIRISRQPVLPGSASSDTNQPLPQGPVRTSPSSAVMTPRPSVQTANVPRVPDPIATSKVEMTPPNAAGAPPKPTISSTPPPPPPAKKPRRIIRKFLTTLIILSALGFGGGVYYSRINDTFHDFFTEYVPYGEEAVLYLEERDFRQRFSGITSRPSKPRDTGNTVTIPSRSGVSPKIAEVDQTQGGPKTSEALKEPHGVPNKEKVAAVEKVKKEDVVKPVGKKEKPTKKRASKKTEEKESSKKESSGKKRAPEVNEPSVFPTEIAPLEPIKLNDPTDPIIADLAKVINEIIGVINQDAKNLKENVKFASTLDKSKREIIKAGERIMALKQETMKSADEKIQQIHREFDGAAQDLIIRLQGEMQDHETRWQSEFESERQKLQDAFESRLKAEVEKQEELNAQKLENKLLEQAFALQKHFVSEIKSRVEEEREGRLGKLSELTAEITELEQLSSEWNKVLEANLKTQHLHIAVEAVRAKLEESNTIPRPFVRELAALKEIAAGDAVVDAAIASINPLAYQKGIPSSAQLIDRFRRVAGEVRKASLLPDDAGIASHASSLVLSKLMFRKSGGGMPDGNDVESVLARTEMLLEEGDLDNAAREMTTLRGWAARLSSDWLAEARKVLEVRQALDVVAAEARLESLRIE